MVSIITDQLCYRSEKATIDNTCTNRHGNVTIKLYLQKQAADKNWPTGYI